MTYGLVNKIIPHSVVDGEGNRMAVFFQGCNFNCIYCHNPETINHCNHCGSCVDGCPVGALSLEEGKVIWNKKTCVDCDNCVKVCPNLSSPKITKYSPEELAEIACDQIPFISGVTCSGGECTLQWQFIAEFFKLVREKGLSTLIDTNGGTDLSKMGELLEVCDGAMVDIKAFDSTEHQQLIGVDNDLVIRNIIYLASIGKLTELRTVCLSHIDNLNTVKSTLELIKDTGALQNLTYKIIGYRDFGVRQQYKHLKAPTNDELATLVELVKSYGVKKVVLI